VIGRVSFTTIDAIDPDRLAAFWARCSGTVVEETSDNGRFATSGSSDPQARSSGLVRQVGPPSPFREISSPP
jgi:hypothetical protein